MNMTFKWAGLCLQALMYPPIKMSSRGWAKIMEDNNWSIRTKKEPILALKSLVYSTEIVNKLTNKKTLTKYLDCWMAEGCLFGR